MSKQWSAHLNGTRMALIGFALLLTGAALYAALLLLSPSSPHQEIGAIAQYGEPGGAGAGGGGTGQVGVSGAGGDGLPFTGLIAVPLLILGAALLASGGYLRRRMSGSDSPERG